MGIFMYYVVWIHSATK